MNTTLHAYYVQLALRSLRRNPFLTALMVLAIGLGIGASMTTYAAFRAVGSDPIPWKSRQLFMPQLDPWGPTGRNDNGEPPDAWDYDDAMNVLKLRAAARQSPISPIGFALVPDNADQKPFTVEGHAVGSEFFAMVDAPFASGSAWAASDDEARTPVVVIGHALNAKLFGTASGVGRTVNLGGETFRIVGVLKDWNPQPRYFDMGNSDAFGDPEDVFVPFNWVIDKQLRSHGNNNCNADALPGWDGWLHSTCVWMSLLVELPTAADVERFRRALDGYAADQQKSGRFSWAPNNRLRDIPAWLDHEHVVPDEVRVLMLIAFSFLVVCLVNVIGLMLAKFLRRAPEIGVRRALGASKREIYKQFLIEAGVVGLAGGGLGLVLTILGQRGVLALFDVKVDQLKHVDLTVVGITLGVSLLVTVIAGFYPTARAASVRPAWQLKSN